jgi:AhpD family alkylhydroperoxidase
MTYDPDTFKRNAGHLHRLASEVGGAFSGLHDRAFSDGTLSASTKELMALAVSIVLGCEECCGYHLERARAKGADREQVAEALGVAVAMGGGPAYTYAAKTAAMLAEAD